MKVIVLDEGYGLLKPAKTSNYYGPGQAVMKDKNGFSELEGDNGTVYVNVFPPDQWGEFDDYAVTAGYLDASSREFDGELEKFFDDSDSAVKFANKILKNVTSTDLSLKQLKSKYGFDELVY